MGFSKAVMPKQNTEGQVRVDKKSRDRMVTQIEGTNVEKSREFLKSLVFQSPASNSQKIFYKNIPLIMSTPQRRHLGINLIKYLHDLYGENCKAL